MSLIYTLAEYWMGDIPEHFKEMCEKTVEKSPSWLSDSPMILKHKKCAMRPGAGNHAPHDMSLIVLDAGDV